AKRRRHAPDVRSARSGILDRDAIADVDLGLIADDDDLAGARVDGVLHAFTPALRAGRHGTADRGADQGVADPSRGPSAGRSGESGETAYERAAARLRAEVDALRLDDHAVLDRDALARPLRARWRAKQQRYGRRGRAFPHK